MCDGYTLDYLKDLAKRLGVYDPDKKTNRKELCESLHGRIPEPSKLTPYCKKSGLPRLLYQANELGINAKLYSEKNKQELCDAIQNQLNATDQKDEYSNIAELKRGESCYTSSAKRDVVAQLAQRGIKSTAINNKELFEVAKRLGLDVKNDIDRSTLCFIIRKEIAGIERGKNFREIRQKEVASNTYLDFVIQGEEDLSIPQLSRLLPRNASRIIALSEQQILPAVHLADPGNTGLILQHGVGTGKTFAAINTSQVLLRRGIVKKVLVITPTSLLENFTQQFRDYNKDLATDPRYDYYTPALFLNKIRDGTITEPTEDTMVIIDEAHNYRTSIWGLNVSEEAKVDPSTVSYTDTSKRFTGAKVRAVFKYLSYPNVKKVLLLTATPFVNNYYDIENLLAMVEKRGPRPKLEDIPEDIRTLYDDKCLIHVYDTPIDEMGRFPRTEKKTLLYEMSRDYYQKYYEIQSNKLPEDYGLYKPGKLGSYFNGVRRASNTLDKDPKKASEKLSSLMTRVSQDVAANPSVRILVYSSWIEAGLSSITKFLTTNGIKSAAIMGSHGKMERQLAVNEFNRGNINVLLISRAGGEGLDLKATNIVYIVDPTWNDSAVQQIIGRAVRRGSHEMLPPEQRVVKIYSLMLLKPFEAEIKKEKARYPEIFEKVFNDPSTIGIYSDDIFIPKTIDEKRKVTITDKDTGQKIDMKDGVMSIDLYLYKFMKKKQVVLDKYIAQTKESSGVCFDEKMRGIARSLKNYMPVSAIQAMKVTPMSAKIDSIKAQLPGIYIIDLDINKMTQNSPDYPIILAKDIPDSIKVMTGPGIQSLDGDRKLRYILQRDVTRQEIRLSFFYRGPEGNIVRENVNIPE